VPRQVTRCAAGLNLMRGRIPCPLRPADYGWISRGWHVDMGFLAESRATPPRHSGAHESGEAAVMRTRNPGVFCTD
jgi:hypothetical protein